MRVPQSTSPARRDRIMSAALDCFIANGVEATTIEDIRAQSGASVGSIYHHFGSKEQLAGAIFLDALREYQAGFLTELDQHAGAEDGMRAIVNYYLHWVRGNSTKARYLLASREADFMHAAEDELRDLNRQFFARVSDWQQPHVEAGTVRRLPTDLFWTILVGPLHEFSRQWLAGRTTTEIREAGRVLSDTVWMSLRAERQ